MLKTLGFAFFPSSHSSNVLVAFFLITLYMGTNFAPANLALGSECTRQWHAVCAVGALAVAQCNVEGILTSNFG